MDTSMLDARDDHPDHHMCTRYVPAGCELKLQVYVAPSRDHKLLVPYGDDPPEVLHTPVEDVPEPPLSIVVSAKVSETNTHKHIAIQHTLSLKT